MANIRQAVILFSDLVGSARLSEVLKLPDYHTVLLEFQKTACNALKNLDIPAQVRPIDRHLRGDELILIMVIKNPYPKKEELGRVAKVALNLAVDLNVGWFLSDINRPRIRKNDSPYRMGIGIHFGPVVLKSYRWDEGIQACKQTDDPEGFAINFAKRVETASRIGMQTGITISQSFFSICRQAGLPVIIGGPLPTEPKGFELSEPIYELISQDLIVEEQRFKNKDHLKRLKKAFNRDPERFLWLLEMAIETYFIKGSTDPKAYNRAIKLAEEAAQVIPNPTRLLYRAARAYHRKGDFKGALRYYEYAANSNDPNLIWAVVDQVASHWKLSYQKGHDRIGELERAKNICEKFINQEPRHFYAYNLHALLLAELAIEKKGPDAKPLIKEALNNLKMASKINSKPIYLYLGTMAHIKCAENRRSKVEELINKAKDECPDIIPPEHFYQPGFAVLGFQPPRKNQLETNWNNLLTRCSR